MTEMSRNPEAVAEAIRKAQRIAVCSHVNPDGDTLGCATAMRLALMKLGKEVSLFCDGKVPDVLTFLPGAGEIRIPTGKEGPFDLMLAVDVSDEKRLGACTALREVSATLADYERQVRGIGTNVNQMARVANGQGVLPSEAVLERLSDQIEDVRREGESLWLSIRSSIARQSHAGR